MDLTSGSSGSDAPLTFSVSCIHALCCSVHGGLRPASSACPPLSIVYAMSIVSGFYRFTVAPPERDCSGAHARSLARCLRELEVRKRSTGRRAGCRRGGVDDEEEGAEEGSCAGCVVERRSSRREETLSLRLSAQRHLHQCTTAPRAQTGRFLFVRLMPFAAWRLGLPARSDGFFIPYRVPIRVPYGQRANLSAGGSSQPATLGPGHRATIVRLHLGPGHRAAVLLSAWCYPWVLPRRSGKHRKLYREDSPYSTDRRRRVCAHGANDRPHNSTCTIHADWAVAHSTLSPSRCHQKC